MAKSFSLKADQQCFVCGRENVHGLQVEWKTEKNYAEADFYATQTYQGWQGLVHGGILSTLMDEAMTRLAWHQYGEAVTAEIKVRFYNAARIGEKLTIKGEIGEMKNRLIPGKAEIRNARGRLIASATGKVIKPKDNLT